MDKNDYCLHEKDFGIIFTKIDAMTEAFKIQTIAMDGLKIAVDAAVQYQVSMEAITDKEDKDRMPHLYKTAIIVASIFSCAGIIVTLIITYIK